MGATLTIREDLSERLERLAKTTKESKSSLVSQALEEFLTVHEWHITEIKEGIEAANKEDFISHEEAVDELKKWSRRAS